MADECKGRGACPSKALYEVFESLRITTETVDYIPREGRQDAEASDKIYCKNLFLKDRKGFYYLVISEEGMVVNLKSLKEELGAHRNFSFASSHDLLTILRARAGCVSPFALMNVPPDNITLAMESSLCKPDKSMYFHPLDPGKCTLVSFQSLVKFLSHYGHTVKMFKA